jgi:hypothetical protein
VERDKPSAMACEVAQGKRAPIVAGTTFLALSVDVRGHSGEGITGKPWGGYGVANGLATPRKGCPSQI